VNVAIVAAAGYGQRLGAKRAKQFLDLAGEPVLIRTLRHFEECPHVDQIIVALPEEEKDPFTQLASAFRLKKIAHLIAGGEERQESVYNALQVVPREHTEIIVVHDGVRPFVTSEEIARVIEAARAVGAAILAVPASDTVKEVEGNRVIRTLNRSRLYLVQTPQAFRSEVLFEAYERAMREGFIATDDAALVEHYGWPVCVVEGSARNIKITWPEDLILGEALLRTPLKTAEGGESAEEKKEPLAPSTSSAASAGRIIEGLRIGIGYDIHPLEEGRKLILGGIEIPFTRGLAGHSDADVLIHSLCDAILGAAALGDLGQHFPDSDPRYKNISSLKLLEEVMALAFRHGYTVENVDATILAEQPRLSSFIEAMRVKLAEVMKISPHRVSVKAKTHERLDPIGRGEAIAAYVVCLLHK